MHWSFKRIELKKKSRNEGNALFNNALNTFYLRLYGVGEKKIKTKVKKLYMTFKLSFQKYLY